MNRNVTIVWIRLIASVALAVVVLVAVMAVARQTENIPLALIMGVVGGTLCSYPIIFALADLLWPE